MMMTTIIRELDESLALKNGLFCKEMDECFEHAELYLWVPFKLYMRWIENGMSLSL